MDSKLENLLMNMHSGLLPENLSIDEVLILQNKYGQNWFAELGYTEDKYKKPVFPKPELPETVLMSELESVVERLQPAKWYKPWTWYRI